MNILGIETSCDETAAAIVKDGKEILSSAVASQADLFAKYGGVIPEIASRKHLELLTPIINQALEEASLKLEDIDRIAYTEKPGLLPALLVGISHAKALALALGIPAIPISHLEAHVYANSLNSQVPNTPLISGEEKRTQKLSHGEVATKTKDKNEHSKKQTSHNLQLSEEELSYPHICLLVSGGHTMILQVSSPIEYTVLGQTRDDAAGEAFDKVARLLDLPYPGGPIIDKMARDGDPKAYKFPRPMMNTEDYDFSFSGLKTAVLNEVKKRPEVTEDLSDELKDQLDYNWKADIAASFQEAAVDVLISKTLKAAISNNADVITLAGGVAANSRLREKMIQAADEMGLDVQYPPITFCMDNAAMIAGLGYWKVKMNY